MLIGGAEQSAQNEGSGLAAGVQQGVQNYTDVAQLALKKQQLDLNVQENQRQIQAVQQAKIDKTMGYFENATKMPEGPMRNTFLKSYIPSAVNAMGLTDVFHPDSMKMAQSNPALIAYMTNEVKNGNLQASDLYQAIADPDKMSVIAASPAFKAFGGQQEIQEAMQNSIGEIRQAADTASANAFKDKELQARMAEARNKDQNAMAMKQLAVQASGNKAGSQDVQQTLQLLESARGNSEVQQAQKDMYSAQKAKSLVNMYGDPNKLSTAQVQLLSSEVAKIAQGGVPSMHELDALTPNTLESRFASTWGKLNNNPTPANAAAFVKQYADYASTLEKDAKAVVADKYSRVLNSKRSKLSDADYQTLKQNYLDPVQAPSGTVMFNNKAWPREQLQQLIDQHPNDPKVAAAKAALQGG